MSYGSAPKFQKTRVPFDALIVEQLSEHAGNAKQHVERTVNATGNKIQSMLRARTQLGRGRLSSKSIVVSDEVPPEVQVQLGRLSPFELWLLANRQVLKSSVSGLSSVRSNAAPIVSAGHNVDMAALQGSSSLLTELAERAKQVEDSLLSGLLECEFDILGAYFPHGRRIELYWVMIWLYARRLGVTLADLTIVVSTHELAHFFTHYREDADGRRWDAHQFLQSDTAVVEGLAQFYTEAVCKRLQAETVYACKGAFDVLLRNQPWAYTCFQQWAPRHPRRGEVLRIAMLQARCGATKVVGFEQMLAHAGGAI